MQVGFLGIGHVKVNDIVNFININTTSHQVGRNQQSKVPLSKLLVSSLSLSLVIVILSISPIKLPYTRLSSFRQLRDESIGFITTFNENDALVQFASSQDLFQVMELQRLRNFHIVLFQLIK